MGADLSGDKGDQSARVHGPAHGSSAVLDILVQRRYLNNRAEHSHRPTRQREQRMQGFKSPGHAQRFLSAYGPIAQHFRPRRHLFHAPEYREEMENRFHTRQDIMPLPPAI
jgi:transposase-like protein